MKNYTNYIKVGKSRDGKRKSYDNYMVIGINPAKPNETISVHYKQETDGTFTAELHSCKNVRVDMSGYDKPRYHTAWTKQQQNIISLYGAKYSPSGALYFVSGSKYSDRVQPYRAKLIELAEILVTLKK